MSSHTRLVSVPHYAAQFACIGGACPQTCCAGWAVDIDKANYKAIKKAKASEALTKKINLYIQPLEHSPSHLQFARVQMASDESCPMLNVDKLCDIHSELGEDYLSNTCRNYPRSINSIPSGLEMYLTLSCPEAARLCLTHQGDWGHEVFDTKIPKGKPVSVRTLKPDLSKNENKHLLHAFDVLRDFIFYCIQFQGAPLWHRIMVIGLTVKKIASIPSEQWEGANFVESQILPIKLDLITGTFSAQLDQDIDLKGKSGLQAKFVQAMTDLRVLMIAPGRAQHFSPQFSELVTRSFEAYNRLSSQHMDSVYEHLAESMVAFEKQAPRFFENYLCNAVGKEGGQFCEISNLESIWLKISLRLALLRFYLKGLSASPEGLSTEEAIQMVYSFSKVIEHNSLYEKTVSSMLKEEQMDGMASVAIMLA